MLPRHGQQASLERAGKRLEKATLEQQINLAEYPDSKSPR
jgi:hypothetical protein